MQTSLTRRRFLVNSSLAATAAWMAPRSLFSQTPAPNDVVAQSRATGLNAKISTQPLRGSVRALMGSGGNIAVLPGREGKVIVDSGYSTSKPQIASALAAISADPVSHLINTHWHFDHTDGNEWMHGAGASILAHENTKKRLSTPQTMAAFGATFPAAPAGAIPTQTFVTDETITLNGVTLVLTHFEPAHTDSDISVHFVEPDVLHVGDTWFNGFYPFIDYSSGGSIDGMIRATERTLAKVSATTVLIPGHGPIGNKAQLVEYRDVLVSARNSVAALKKQGKTLPEVVAAKPTATFDAKWGAGFMPPTAFLGLVYQGV